MRLLFEMDLKDYASCTHRFVRNSARSIVIENGKAAMIHSVNTIIISFRVAGLKKVKARLRP